MAVNTPNRLTANNVQQLTDVEVGRDIVVGPYIVPVGGIVVAANNDIIQLTPKFEGPRQRKLRLSGLSVELDSGVAAANDDIVLVGQVSEVAIETIKADIGANDDGISQAEYLSNDAALQGTIAAGVPISLRIYDGGFFVGLRVAAAGTVAANKNARVLMKYSVHPSADATHKVSDGSAY